MHLWTGFVRDGNEYQVYLDSVPVKPFRNGLGKPASLVPWHWGEDSAGARQLAHAILTEWAGLQIAEHFYLSFCSSCVAQWPTGEGWCWTITGADLAPWLLAAARAGIPSPPGLAGQLPPAGATQKFPGEGLAGGGCCP